MTMHKQQKTDYWDIARMSKMPGAKITAQIDPSTWTVRTRNAVKRMMQTACIVGGHSSVSRALAVAVSNQYEVKCSRSYDKSHVSASGLTQEQIDFIAPLVDADFVAKRLAHSYGTADHHKAIKVKLAQGGINHYFEQTAYATRINQMLAKSLPEGTKQAAAQACAAIDNNETIYIELT